MSLEVGDKAPEFSLPADGGRQGRAQGLQGKACRALFLSQGRHLGLHGGGMRVPRREARFL